MVLLMRHRGWLLPLVTLCAVCLAGCVERSWEVRTYPMGEKVTLGHLTYIAFETQWRPALGDGPAARAAQNEFLLVRLSVTNGGTAEAAVPSLSVEDGTGHSFPESNDGEGVTDWIGALRVLAPADTVGGEALFDVPSGHYTLHILDEDGQHDARIDLPLSFQTVPSEMPMPNLPKPAPVVPSRQ
jgi:hypothetical protein